MSHQSFPESYYPQWQQINDWLVQHQIIWRPTPFTQPRPEWLECYPGLARMVEGFSDAECDWLDDRPDVLANMAADYLPDLEHYGEMVNMPELGPEKSEVDAATLPEIRAKDMPGRKRAQAGAFSAALRPLQHPVLDWCSGKGHLSRTLAMNAPYPVEGYEWNPGLVADGNRLAEHFADAVHIHCQDVMDSEACMPGGAHGVALHACGDLHRQLLKRGASAGMPRLSVSPCCYHKTIAGVYAPLSGRAATHDNSLCLDSSDLRLAVRETVTAPAGVREQTRVLSQWRLGFDGLQRFLRGVDQYLAVPSCSPRRLQRGFPAFCHWAAEQKHISLPEGTDFDRWLAYGAQRQAEVRRYELVRHLFRRPLELWLVLDYAIYLEEQGYNVRLGRFCARSLTPRNLLLDASKSEGAPGRPH